MKRRHHARHAAALWVALAGWVAHSQAAYGEDWPTPAEGKYLPGRIEQARRTAATNKDPKTRERAQLNLQEMELRLRQVEQYQEQPKQLFLPVESRSRLLVKRNGPEADLVVRVGDIDNFGFGAPGNLLPFVGRLTPPHPFPWYPRETEPEGTDRVMVTSGMKSLETAPHNRYAETTFRPYNTPQPLTFSFDLKGLEVKTAVLQLFADGLQAPSLGNRFVVTVNERNAPDIAALLNRLELREPVGRLITLQLLPEYLTEIEGGKMVVTIDDPYSNVGNGFAIDFARLLINPKPWAHSGSVRGVAVDKATGKPLRGVLVSASNVLKTQTDAQGRFELSGVPAGLALITASDPAYQTAAAQRDLEAKQSVEVRLELEPAATSGEALAKQVAAEGKVDLYGIYFDTNEATLKADSTASLQQVLALLNARPELQVVIVGHTDSEGSDAQNLDLSKRRAASVVKWLTERRIAPGRLRADGFGELQPVADNGTVAGRALNRRVEIRDARR